MPWSTPTLRSVRTTVRDFIHALMPGSDANVPNSILRVMADVTGAMCHLTLQYQDWLSKQLLPDTAETEWLDRHAQIWLVNSDGTVGRKQATLAQGTVTATGTAGSMVPAGSTLTSGLVGYEVLVQIIVGATPTPMPIRALDPGIVGNQPIGTLLPFDITPVGVDSETTVVALYGGTDQEKIGRAHV